MAIEIRNNAVRIDFYYKGIRCKETVKYRGSKSHSIDKKKKFAKGMLAAIEHEIDQGTFSYQKYFPNSKKLEKFGYAKTEGKLFCEILENWLMIQKAKLAPSTFKNYNSKARTHIRPAFSDKLISSILKADIEIWITTDLLHLNNKTVNEIMIIMRGVFKSAKADNLIKSSPMDLIDNRPVLTPEFTPFTKDEITLILSTETLRIQELNLVKFNIWSGLRVSELFALSWDDIDLDKETAHIQIARVENVYKTTKTRGSNRTIELLSPAIEVLKAQISLTFDLPGIDINVLQEDNKTFIKQSFRPVFVNTNTLRPHCNYDSLNNKFWKKHLKKSGVKYRAIKFTRHTYASQLLSTGKISKEWIIKQMGHTSAKMIDHHYAKWIYEDAPPMAKIADKALGFKS